MDPKWIADHFKQVQLFILMVILFVAWLRWKDNQQTSKFKRREFDRPDLDRIKQGPDLASARLKSPPVRPLPLSLPGIRLHGEPHEILGVDANASEVEIMKAYKNAIKQYHPDRIQRQAQSQIAFYQEASAQLNQAKEKMIQNLRKK